MKIRGIFFHNFCLSLGLSANFPVPIPNILLFIASQKYHGAASSTITKQISILSHFHKLNGVHNPVESFIVTKALVGIRNLTNHLPDARLLITLPILQRLLQAASISITSPNESKLIRAMMTLAFKAFLRVGEMLPKSENGGAQNCLHYNDLIITNNQL